MSEYPKPVRYGLWFFAELGVIAATIPGGIELSVPSFSFCFLTCKIIFTYCPLIFSLLSSSVYVDL